MEFPLVYVLVTNWNGREHLEECLDTLLAGTYPNVRVMLLDNDSKDESVEFVRARYADDPRLEIVQLETNLGWAAANNIGLEKALDAGAAYAFLLNNDTATAPDALENLVEMAKSRPEIGALAPKILLHSHPALLNSLGVECSTIGVGWDKGLGRLDGPQWNEPRPVLGVCGAACLIRTELLRKTGLFPGDYEIYLDDLDLSLRIWNAGYEVWNCPAAVVRHKLSATMGQPELVRRKYYLNTRNRFRLLLRHFPIRKLVLLKPVIVLGECKAIGRAAVDGEYWRVAAHLRAWASTLLYYPRAIAARVRFRRSGLGNGRFWHLIRHDVLFFPGVELPTEGWYSPRRIGGLEVRPISARARMESREGRLRCLHVNCYPRLGLTEIEVFLNGARLTTLSTLDRQETLIETTPGCLEFVAKRIFDADDTGEGMDFGGWLAIHWA